MIDYKNLTPCDKDVTFYDKKEIVRRFGIDIKAEKSLLPSLVKLCDFWKVPYDEIADFILSNGYEIDLFEYNIHSLPNSCSKMVASNAVFSIENVIDKYGIKREKIVYHDIYVNEYKYISLTLPIIISHIIEVYYPKFFISEKIRKFDDVKLSAKDTLSDVNFKYWDKTLTIGDVCAIMKGEVIYENKIKYDIYNDGDVVYYKLGDVIVHGVRFSRSLYIPREAIINNDWSIVENYYIHGVIKEDANNKFGKDSNNYYSGEQKYAPYWNHPSVKEIKKLFDKAV